MNERPIIFSASSIRALLYGRKSQTRRVVKPQPIAPFHSSSGAWVDMNEVRGITSMRCPYGEPGDIVNSRHRVGGTTLWVRETWHSSPHFDCLYRADFDAAQLKRLPKVAAHGGWRSPIHMPRAMSRITLRVTDVRVQRLQDITEADAVAEGVFACGTVLSGTTARECYRRMWESISGPGSWDENPWVWVIEFLRLSQ